MQDTRLTERVPGARLAGSWKDYLCVVGYDSLYFLHDGSGDLRGVALPELLVGISIAPSFAASTSCVFLSPGGYTVFRLRLEGVLDAPPLASLPPDATILGVHPHPLRRNGVVRVNTEHAGNAEVDLVDMLGRSRARLFSGFADAGEHAFPFALPSLPAGCYLLRLRSGARTLFHPVVVGR